MNIQSARIARVEANWNVKLHGSQFVEALRLHLIVH
jgi:hypothetical protein